jgi:ribokinase
MSRLFVLGNAGLDVTLTMGRMPRPGETLIAESAARAPGGKGLNQAVTAARAGADVAFSAALGRDTEAARVLDALAQEQLGFEPRYVAAPTDLSLILVSAEGENCIVTAGAAAAAYPVEEAGKFGSEVGPGDWLLMQGNLSEPATRAAMRSARGRIILNTAPLNWPIRPLLPMCDLVIANAVEAESVTGVEAEAAARALIEAGARAAVVSLGSRGAVAAERDAAGVVRVIGSAAHPAAVVDSSGAGDTLCGLLAAALAADLPLMTALERAQAAAALTVSRPGAFAALPTAAELQRILSHP